MKFIILGRLPRLHVGCIKVRVVFNQIVFLIRHKKREYKVYFTFEKRFMIHLNTYIGFNFSDFNQHYFIYMNLLSSSSHKSSPQLFRLNSVYFVERKKNESLLEREILNFTPEKN